MIGLKKPPRLIGLRSGDISRVYASRLATLLFIGKFNSDPKLIFRMVGRLNGEAGNGTSYSPLGAGARAELGNAIRLGKVYPVNEETSFY